MSVYRIAFLGQPYMGVAYQAIISERINAEIEVFEQIAESIQKIFKGEFDLIIIETGIGRKIAYEFASKISNSNQYLNEPIVFTGDSFNISERKDATRLGVIGCFARTLMPDEFACNLSKILNLSRNFRPKRRKGNLVIDAIRTRVFIDEEEIDITLNEFRLLSAIMQFPCTPIDRDHLMGEVWRYKIEKGTFSTHIANLNRKLENWEYRLSIGRKAPDIIIVSNSSQEQREENLIPSGSINPFKTESHTH